MSSEKPQLSRQDWMERNAHYIQEVQYEAGQWETKNIQSMQSTIEFAVQAIKACYLLNASGIGVIAVAGKELHLIAPDLLLFSIPFFAGLVAGVICNLLSYLAQGQYSLMCFEVHNYRRLEIGQKYFPEAVDADVDVTIEDHTNASTKHETNAKWLRVGAIFAGCVSMAAFCYGGWALIELHGLG